MQHKYLDLFPLLPDNEPICQGNFGERQIVCGAKITTFNLEVGGWEASDTKSNGWAANPAIRLKLSTHFW